MYSGTNSNNEKENRTSNSNSTHMETKPTLTWIEQFDNYYMWDQKNKDLQSGTTKIIEFVIQCT